MRTRGPRPLVLALLLGCAVKQTEPPPGPPHATSQHPHDGVAHDHVDSDEQVNLVAAGRDCPGPAEPVVVRVLDSDSLPEGEPLAFLREPEIRFVVMLHLVETLAGPVIGEHMGVLVHSPSRFAARAWSAGEPQKHPATLKLAWSREYCMYEVTDVIPPQVAGPNSTAPRVHSALVGQ
jgi:hypothetical protein